jgi:hypothetical protein
MTAKGLGQYVMGKPCKNGHDGLRYRGRHDGIRYLAGGSCVACTKERGLTTTHKEKLKVRRATPHGRAVVLSKNVQARVRARGEKSDLTTQWIEDRLVRGVCEVSGIPFDLTNDGKASPYSPSVDRIDNSKGYQQDNCRVILWALNLAFNRWGQDVFYAIALSWVKLNSPRLDVIGAHHLQFVSEQALAQVNSPAGNA